MSDPLGRNYCGFGKIADDGYCYCHVLKSSAACHGQADNCLVSNLEITAYLKEEAQKRREKMSTRGTSNSKLSRYSAEEKQFVVNLYNEGMPFSKLRSLAVAKYGRSMSHNTILRAASGKPQRARKPYTLRRKVYISPPQMKSLQAGKCITKFVNGKNISLTAVKKIRVKQSIAELKTGYKKLKTENILLKSRLDEFITKHALNRQ